jgi:hypothetical protein
MNRFHLVAVVSLVVTGLILPPEVEYAEAASQITYGRGRHVSAAPRFVSPMQCIVNKIQSMGYQPRDIGCFGYRPHNRSAHPTGHACDVDQTSRNKTRLNAISRNQQISVAQGCKAVSGCRWRNPDCGHFEAMSAPYSPAGARAGGHHYGEKYAKRPVHKKRRRRR